MFSPAFERLSFDRRKPCGEIQAIYMRKRSVLITVLESGIEKVGVFAIPNIALS